MTTQNTAKTIAKNTGFMYFRMIALTILGILTIRIVMQYMGVKDYGLYSLVNGVVLIFGFLSNATCAATYRFLNFAMGEQDFEKANRIYSSSVVIHRVVALVIILLAETAGLWIVNNYLVIDSERLFAANICFQIILVSNIFTVLNIPSTAIIVAYENMSLYFFISFFEIINRIVMVIAICFWNVDKLILYTSFYSLERVVTYIVFKIYTNKKFEISKFKMHNDKNIYKEMLSFAGWNMLSGAGNSCSNQVLTVVLNRFFGLIANAALGIANQAKLVVFTFVTNFQFAFEPRITKTYASGDLNNLEKFVFSISKLSFFLLWFIILPLGINAKLILKIWLSNVPEYSEIFLILVLVNSLIDAMSGPLNSYILAIGKIKNYQIFIFTASVVTIPLAYLGFTVGMPPYLIICIAIGLNILLLLYKISYLSRSVVFSALNYCVKVILICILLAACTFAISFFVFKITAFNGIVQFFASCSMTVIANVLLIYFLGLNKSEKKLVLGWVGYIIKKRNKK